MLEELFRATPPLLICLYLIADTAIDSLGPCKSSFWGELFIVRGEKTVVLVRWEWLEGVLGSGGEEEEYESTEAFGVRMCE